MIECQRALLSRIVHSPGLPQSDISPLNWETYVVLSNWLLITILQNNFTAEIRGQGNTVSTDYGTIVDDKQPICFTWERK